MLDNIKIVLVRTFHPGNIGSAARAMKTMGLTDLCLVSPVDFPSDQTLRLARGASDVVEKAAVVDSVYEAVKDCQVVVASTARQREFDLPELSPEDAAKMLNSYASNTTNNKVALLFGPERMGLSNEDLQFAKYRVTIPTNPDFSSLNMAAAVQTICYEVFKGSQIAQQQSTEVEQLPNTEELERFYVHMEETLVETGFIFKKHPGEVMRRFRNVFAKAQLTTAEVSLLRGVLSSFQGKKS
ncbi:MAG: RNA methyltransferase [Thiotrichaceae bacterium]